MELLVQQYLRSGKTLRDLRAEHGINYRVIDDRVSLSYDQLESKESDELARECRGLILCTADWNRIATPMPRFFNYGTHYAADIDWQSAIFAEKLDGTLIIAYWWDGSWHVATRSVPDASNKVKDNDVTYAKLVDIACERTTGFAIDAAFSSYDEVSRDKTYCFELTSQYNRIYVQYSQPELHLIAVRDRETLIESDPEPYATRLGISLPRLYHFNNQDEMLQAIQGWNPTKNEGVVVRDKHFHRIKVKNPSYLALARMSDKTGTSWRACLELILHGQDDDAASILPIEMCERLNKLKPLVAEIIKQTNDAYETNKNLPMKEFAMAVRDELWPGALFAMKRGKASSVMGYVMDTTESGIRTGMLKSILVMCQKLDPTLKAIE